MELFPKLFMTVLRCAAIVIFVSAALLACEAPTALELEEEGRVVQVDSPEGQSILAQVGGKEDVYNQVQAWAEDQQGLGKATSNTTVKVGFTAVNPIRVYEDGTIDLALEVVVNRDQIRQHQFVAVVPFGRTAPIELVPAIDWPGYVTVKVDFVTAFGIPLKGVNVDHVVVAGRQTGIQYIVSKEIFPVLGGQVFDLRAIATGEFADMSFSGYVSVPVSADADEVFTANLRQPEPQQTDVCIPRKLVNDQLDTNRWYDLRIDAEMKTMEGEQLGDFYEERSYNPRESEGEHCFRFGTQDEFDTVEFDLLETDVAYPTVFASFALARDQFECQRRSGGFSGGLEGNIKECDYVGEKSSISVVFSNSQNDPDVSFIEVDEDDESDDFTVHAFRVDVQGGDAPVKTGYVTTSISNPQGGESDVLVGDVLDYAALVVEGEYFSITNYGDIRYLEIGDGSTMNVQLEFRFDGYELVEGLQEVAVIASFGEAMDYDNDTQVSFGVTKDDAEDWQFDSQGSVTLEGSTQGQTHTLSSGGLILHDIESISWTNDSSTRVSWEVQVEVTAFGDDAYLRREDMFLFDVYHSGGFSIASTATSTADIVGGSYVVREGETEVFTLVVTLSDFSESGYVSLEVEELRYGATSSGQFDFELSIDHDTDEVYVVVAKGD